MNHIAKYTIKGEDVWVALDDNGPEDYFVVPLVTDDRIDGVLSKTDTNLKVINLNRLTPKDLREIVKLQSDQLFSAWDGWNEEATTQQDRIAILEQQLLVAKDGNALKAHLALREP